jgi:hypothetical protein
MVLGLLLLLAFRLRSVSSCAVGLALLTCKKKGSQPVAVLLCEKGWRRQGKKKDLLIGLLIWEVQPYQQRPASGNVSRRSRILLDSTYTAS